MGSREFTRVACTFAPVVALILWWSAAGGQTIKGARINGLRVLSDKIDDVTTPEAILKSFVKPGMTGLWQVSGRNERTYREAMSLHQALTELRAGAGTQFDPDCVVALEDYLANARSSEH